MDKGLEVLNILKEHFENMSKEELLDLEKRAVDYAKKIKEIKNMENFLRRLFKFKRFVLRKEESLC